MHVHRRAGTTLQQKRFLTLRRHAIALGGAARKESPAALRAHNAHTARQVFGEEHIERKRADARKARAEPARVREQVLSALVR
ncbi:MAG: hypothetical protein IPI67_19510 [Myxococcales bacterium]|nr:hypothetical protein [Myxococcales bacterium]